MNETKLFLEQCFEFINGGTWNENEYSLEGIHVVKVTNLVNSGVERKKDDSYLPWSKYEKYQKHKLFEGDVVIATVGSHPTQQGSVVGRTSRIPKDFDGSFLNQNAVCLRNKDTNKINSRYFFYLTKTILFKGYIEGRAKGSANQVRMALSDLKKFNYYFPHISYQRKIAAILSTYDDLIENNNKRIALLEKMAEEIYLEWFVHFRFPGYQDIKFEKGIPKGWSVKSLGNIFDTASGGTPSRKDIRNYNGKINWLKTGELKSIFAFESEEKITLSGLESSSAKIFPINTIVIAMYCAMPDISILAEPAATNQACCAFLPKLDYFTYHYNYYLIKYAQPHLIQYSHGAAQQNLSQDLIKRFEVLIANEFIIKKYTSIVDPLFQEIKIIMKQNKILREYKNMLLPRLISGKLSVENLDIAFPPSMQQEEGKVD